MNRRVLTKWTGVVVIAGALLGVFVTPASPEVTYSWNWSLWGDPLRFNVGCGAETNQGEIGGMYCRGYYVGEYTPTCGPTGSAQSIWCTTAYETVDCPDGLPHPMVASAWSVQGDTPSSKDAVAYMECDDSEEW